MPDTSPIIVIDDDAQVRRAFGRVLKAHGYATREFASAEEFLAGEPWQAGCLVLDVDLGGMSGIELYRQILARNGRIPPAVFVTGKMCPAVEARARELGAAGFLSKPVEAADLMSSVRRANGEHPG